eukprot:4004599-Alexandrium_andersonii.AAC.1
MHARSAHTRTRTQAPMCIRQDARGTEHTQRHIVTAARAFWRTRARKECRLQPSMRATTFRDLCRTLGCAIHDA